MDVANKELNIKQKELDIQLGKTKTNTVDELFDDKLIGQARPYLTGTAIDPETGKPGYNLDAVRNTLQGGLLAIKQLHPEVEIPDISDLDLNDGRRIDGIRKFILGYVDGAFDLPFSSQGIGFVPLKPKSQLTHRARAIIGSMNNYSTVTGGGRNTKPVQQTHSSNQRDDEDDSSTMTIAQLRASADSLLKARKEGKAPSDAEYLKNWKKAQDIVSKARNNKPAPKQLIKDDVVIF